MHRAVVYSSYWMSLSINKNSVVFLVPFGPSRILDMDWTYRHWRLFVLVSFLHTHDSIYAIARICYRPSVRLSVTRRYRVKTKKASVMISSPSGISTILVLWCQISSRNSKGFPRAGASKKGGVGKISHFLALSVNISKTVSQPKLLLVTNRKSYVNFRMTIDP